MPPGVVIVNMRALGAALPAMVNGTVTHVALADVILPTATPLPEMATLIPGVKFAPLMVTVMVLPGPPEAGLTFVIVGAPGEVMVNVAGSSFGLPSLLYASF